MRCLSCQREVTTKGARLWERKILVCIGCGELADKAKREMDIALHRAEEAAMADLEQKIMRCVLLAPASGVHLPGCGESDA